MAKGEVTAALLIIGNEILSGRVQDENVAFLAKGLNEVGIRLKEVRVMDPRAREAFMGPVINKAAVETFEDAVKSAEKKGKIFFGAKTSAYQQPSICMIRTRSISGISRPLQKPMSTPRSVSK